MLRDGLKLHRYAFLLDWHPEVKPGGTSQSTPTYSPQAIFVAIGTTSMPMWFRTFQH
jgi:hypothetical protein